MTSNMKRNYKERLFIVLAITIVFSSFLCGVLFYKLCSRLPGQDTHSHYSYDQSHYDDVKNVFQRFKRGYNTLKSLDYMNRCKFATPSTEDIKKLCKNQECGTIHCVRSRDCRPGSSDSKEATCTCFSKACSTFDANFSASSESRAEEGITLGRLSRLIDFHYKGESMSLGIRCSHPQSHLYRKPLKLEVTTDLSRQCLQNGSNNVTDTPQHQEASRAKNGSVHSVHVIYFRFLSKWEGYFKLPRLNALIEHKGNDLAWHLESFDAVQSESLGLADNLLSIFGREFRSSGNENRSQYDADLIETAIDMGRCVTFNFISCHRVNLYDSILQGVASKNSTQNCRFPHHRHWMNDDSGNYSFCSGDQDDYQIEDTLYIDNIIGGVHSWGATNMFTVLIFNVLDLPSMSALDATVTRVVSEILSHGSNSLILLSDVGDPRFTRIDESTFLRTQAFNPLLHIFTPRPTGEVKRGEGPSESPKRRDRHDSQPFRISGVFNITKALILSGEGRAALRDVQTLAASRIDNGSQENFVKGRAICLGKGIKTPVECLCQGNHVWFSNDSVQVAFAALFVGNVNNKLAQLSAHNASGTDELSTAGSHSQEKVRRLLWEKKTGCDRLVGVDFRNVYHVLWRNSTYVLMTLLLRPITARYSELVRVDAEIEYSTDDDYGTDFSFSVLYPTQVNINALLDSTTKYSQQVLHHLCHRPNYFNLITANDEEFLHAILSKSHFNGKNRVKSIHYPCLYLNTITFPDSAVVEATNICTDRSYHLTVSAELVNVISLVHLPAEVTLGPRDVHFISSLVKSTYAITEFAYAIKASFEVL